MALDSEMVFSAVSEIAAQGAAGTIAAPDYVVQIGGRMVRTESPEYWEAVAPAFSIPFASPGRNPHGCGYLPPPGGIYISHCSRHHDDSPRYGAHGSVTFECRDGQDCPCDPERQG